MVRDESRGLTFSLLDDRDLEAVHESSLEVLESTGVFVESEQALDLYADHGCQVDRNEKIVRIPSQVALGALESCQPVSVLHGRVRQRDVTLKNGRVAFTNFGEGLFVVDPFTGERRESYKADVAAAALAVDSQDNTEVCWRAVGSRDVPPSVAALHNADAILRATTKHAILSPQIGSLVAPILKLQAAILGSMDAVRDRPLVTLTACPVSPLKLGRDCCDIIMAAARSGVSVNIISMALAGGSGPVTLAGTLVVHNVELLAGITLAQLANPGTAVIYGSVSTGLDLRYAAACVGSPEMALMSAATAETGSLLRADELRGRWGWRREAL